MQKILLGLPRSVLQKLDDYAQSHGLSRPKAIARLLEQLREQPATGIKENQKQTFLDELKALKESLHS